MSPASRPALPREAELMPVPHPRPLRGAAVATAAASGRSRPTRSPLDQPTGRSPKIRGLLTRGRQVRSKPAVGGHSTQNRSQAPRLRPSKRRAKAAVRQFETAVRRSFADYKVRTCGVGRTCGGSRLKVPRLLCARHVQAGPPGYRPTRNISCRSNARRRNSASSPPPGCRRRSMYSARAGHQQAKLAELEQVGTGPAEIPGPVVARSRPGFRVPPVRDGSASKACRPPVRCQAGQTVNISTELKVTDMALSADHPRTPTAAARQADRHVANMGVGRNHAPQGPCDRQSAGLRTAAHNNMMDHPDVVGK
jgi:hypothetical protein